MRTSRMRFVRLKRVVGKVLRCRLYDPHKKRAASVVAKVSKKEYCLSWKSIVIEQSYAGDVDSAGHRINKIQATAADNAMNKSAQQMEGTTSIQNPKYQHIYRSWTIPLYEALPGGVTQLVRLRPPAEVSHRVEPPASTVRARRRSSRTRRSKNPSAVQPTGCAEGFLQTKFEAGPELRGWSFAVLKPFILFALYAVEPHRMSVLAVT